MNDNKKDIKSTSTQIPEKTISMTINELRQELCNVLNNCPLHISIKELVLKDIYTEVNVKNTELLLQDQLKYNEQLKGSTE